MNSNPCMAEGTFPYDVNSDTTHTFISPADNPKPRNVTDPLICKNLSSEPVIDAGDNPAPQAPIIIDAGDNPAPQAPITWRTFIYNKFHEIIDMISNNQISKMIQAFSFGIINGIMADVDLLCMIELWNLGYFMPWLIMIFPVVKIILPIIMILSMYYALTHDRLPMIRKDKNYLPENRFITKEILSYCIDALFFLNNLYDMVKSFEALMFLMLLGSMIHPIVGCILFTVCFIGLALVNIRIGFSQSSKNIFALNLHPIVIIYSMCRVTLSSLKMNKAICSAFYMFLFSLIFLANIILKSTKTQNTQGIEPLVSTESTSSVLYTICQYVLALVSLLSHLIQSSILSQKVFISCSDNVVDKYDPRAIFKFLAARITLQILLFFNFYCQNHRNHNQGSKELISIFSNFFHQYKSYAHQLI